MIFAEMKPADPILLAKNKERENMPRIPVSVVIPCYRCVDTIVRAIDSVAAQTKIPREIIIVDDASDDSTLEKLYEIRDRYGKEWIKIINLQVNSGAGSARNEGWEKATQPYIAFLDGDDSWHPKKLEIQYGFMEGHPEIAMTGHKMIMASNNDIEIDFSEEMRTTEMNSSRFLLGNQLSTPTVIVKRDIDDRFEPGKRYSEDYLLWLKILLKGHKACRIEWPLAFMYKNSYGEKGLSSKLWPMEKGEIENFSLLIKEGYISKLLGMFLITYSLVKYMRRRIISELRSRFVKSRQQNG